MFQEAERCHALAYGTGNDHDGSGGGGGGGGGSIAAKLNRVLTNDTAKRSILDIAVFHARVDVIAWLVNETEAPLKPQHEAWEEGWTRMLSSAAMYAPISGWMGMVAAWETTVQQRRIEQEFMPGGPGALAAAADFERAATTHSGHREL